MVGLVPEAFAQELLGENVHRFVHEPGVAIAPGSGAEVRGSIRQSCASCRKLRCHSAESVDATAPLRNKVKQAHICLYSCISLD